MPQHTTPSRRRPTSTEQTVTVSGGHKSYFTTTSPAEVCFGWHRAVRKGNMIYVSGIIAAKDDVESTESGAGDEEVAPRDAETGHGQRQMLVPSGSGFTVVPVIDEDENRLHRHDDDGSPNEDEGEDQQPPPPYYTSESGDQHLPQMDSERAPQVLHPHDAKQQAVVAMNRCIEAVQRLGGWREDIVRVRMIVTKHEDCRKVGEAFRECFSVQAPLTKPKDRGKKTGRAGIQVSEVGAAATMLVVPGAFAHHDILVEVEAEAVLGSRYQ